MSALWLIEEVNPENEAVHLVKAGTAIRRKFSVPGATQAWMDGDILFIASSTGYVWQIVPGTGHRRRDMQSAQRLPQAAHLFTCASC